MKCNLCSNSQSTSSLLQLIELAACRNHKLCRSCYVEQISNMNTSKGVSCPICNTNVNTNHNANDNTINNDNDNTNIACNYDDNNSNNELKMNTIIVHGLKLSEQAWSQACSNRLLDVQKRYDSYYQYFQQYHAVFIHIPKTAGTSFEFALFNTKNRSQHAKASYWRQRIGSQWEKSFKFAIVRHPFHRLVSGYTYWKNGALAGQEVDQPFVYHCRTEVDTLEKFVSYLLHVHQNNLWDERDIQGVDGTCPIQFRPQTWFLSEDDDNDSNGSNGSNGNNELIKLDFIGRYEDLDKAYHVIKQTIKENNNKNNIITSDFSDFLPHTRASFHPFDLPPIFNDPNFVSKIMEIYKSDFETFNYSI